MPKYSATEHQQPIILEFKPREEIIEYQPCALGGIQICSLGGGVASTALFLMSLHGEIENPADAAMFADTGNERQTTLDTIHFLKDYAKDFGVPVHIVKNDRLPDIQTNALKPDSKIGDMPFHTLDKAVKRRRSKSIALKSSKLNRAGN